MSIVRLAFIAALLLCAGEARAQDVAPVEDPFAAALAPTAGGLTADTAATAAASTSPAVVARSLEIDLARANRDATAARYVPRLTLSAGVTRTNTTDFDFGGGGFSVGALNAGPLTVGPCPAGGGTCVLDAAGMPVGAVAPEPFAIPRNNYRVDANLSVPLSDYLLSYPSARTAARADIDSARRRTDAERAQVELEARVAYYEWLRARASIALAERSLGGVTARLEDARLLLAGGTVAPADVLQIESALASAQVSLNNARSFEAVARTNLATQMGQATAAFTVGEDVRSDIAPLAEKGSLASLIEHGQKHRAELRGLRLRSTAAREAVTGARADLYPRLDAVASGTYANPNPQFFPPEAAWNPSWSIGLTVSWGLDRFFQTRAQIKTLDANRRLFDAQVANLARGVALEVTAAWQEWQRAEAALALNRKAVEAAEAAYQQRVTLYKGGEATTTDVVEAELQRHNATLLDLNARVDLRIARAKLERAAALPPGETE